MTKPTQRLDFWPDPVHAHAVRVQWIGAGWHYRLDFGDGTDPVRVLHTDPPRRHVYPRAGTYTVVATSELDPRITATLRITVRDWTRPPVPEASLDGNRVTLDMPPVPEPVAWRVSWGDGTSTEHGPGDVPGHVYEWGVGAPTITIADMPSRRMTRFTGPEIGPEPAPREYDGFVIEHEATTSDAYHYRLHGGGLLPGSAVLAYPAHQNQYWHLTATDAGRIEQPFSVAIMNNFLDRRWRSVTVQHQGRITHVPFHPDFADRTPTLMYQVDPDNTRRLTFSVFPPVPGRYLITFGDGASRYVDVDKPPVLATYTYPGSATTFTAQVTLPDGRIASRLIQPHPLCPPCYTDGNPGQFDAAWCVTGGWCGACGARWGEQFSPIQWSVGGNAAGWQPLQLHKYTDDTDSGWHVTTVFRGFHAGTYEVTYVKPLVPIERHQVTVARPARIRTFDRMVEGRLADASSDLTAWFGVDQQWDGGYRGTVHIHNHTTEAITGWQVEFTVDEPAVVWEVTPRTATLTDLGGQRWRISSTARIDPSGETTVTARIEPPGSPHAYPRDLVARPTSPANT